MEILAIPKNSYIVRQECAEKLVNSKNNTNEIATIKKSAQKFKGNNIKTSEGYNATID